MAFLPVQVWIILVAEDAGWITSDKGLKLPPSPGLVRTAVNQVGDCSVSNVARARSASRSGFTVMLVAVLRAETCVRGGGQ